jgi:hypothetical protein
MTFLEEANLVDQLKSDEECIPFGVAGPGDPEILIEGSANFSA